ncbi:MAG TPA: phosphoribosylaminoimidazolesuccinocarboxamide synthase, partial [Rhodocyclaceae bacterium]|nr:phosphoribosylaminoimidazolesuccinocarboxamide synthase [Rhodocyclaceae bacterium]
PRVLMVASDRISAFDVIMPTPITGKGALLTRIATWWFGFIAKHRLAETHVLSTDVNDIPREAFEGQGASGSESPAAQSLAGRITKVGENFLHVDVSEGKDGAVEVIVQKSAIANLLPKGTLKGL